MKQLFSLLFLFVFISGLALAQAQETPTLSGKSKVQTMQRDLDVLYDQTAGAGTNSLASQNFEAAYDVYDCQGADDFEVPAGETWSITSIDAPGAYYNGVGPATSFNVWFYTDASGLPGTEVASALNASYTDPGGLGSVTIDISPAIDLSEGTYWISVQANLDYGVGGQWGWTEHLPINTESAWQNPGGGFGSPCTTWGYRVTTCGVVGTTGYPDFAFILNGTSGGASASFYDDMEAYIAGQQLACQNPTDWTTWSQLPCDPTEDPYVSSNYAYSGTNSTVIVLNNDLVKTHGMQTTGHWYSSFLLYIPTGKAGYFNQLSTWDPNPQQWGVEVYFDVGGTGRIIADVTTNFTWQEDTWQQVVVEVDLDSPTHDATIWFGSSDPLTMLYTWDWTRGGTYTNQIDANDYFGATADDEMYIDNVYFDNAMPPIIPVELTSFTAISNNGVVQLNWQTATELNNHLFEIERKTEASEYRTIGYVEGSGTTTEPKNYSYTDNTVVSGSYTYRLKQIDFNGTFTYSPEVEVEVAPLTFNLGQNYPNPFNPSTKIKYDVPEAGNITLAVYNVVGEEVAVLVNGYTEAGSFDVTFDASNLPSGVYLYKLQSDNSVQTKKMILMK